MATISEDYVSFETAKLLKEKGFDQNYATYYLDGQVWRHYHGEVIPKGKQIYAAPTQAVVMKWLREVHKLYITISHRFSHNADQDVCFSYYINIDTAEDGEYMTYEEACEAAIKYCLENLI